MTKIFMNAINQGHMGNWEGQLMAIKHSVSSKYVLRTAWSTIFFGSMQAPQLHYVLLWRKECLPKFSNNSDGDLKSWRNQYIQNCNSIRICQSEIWFFNLKNQMVSFVGMLNKISMKSCKVVNHDHVLFIFFIWVI